LSIANLTTAYTTPFHLAIDAVANVVQWYLRGSKYYRLQSRFARLWLTASVCSYGGLQGAGNHDYCAVTT